MLIIFNIGDLGIYQLQIDSQAVDGVSTYQGLGRSIMVIAIFVLSTIKSKLNFFVIGLISLLTLLLNGARSEFVGVIVAISFIMFAKYKISQFVWFGIIFILGLILILPDLPISVVENSRIFELMRLDESSSAIARSQLMNDAIRTIYEYPIFGNYGSYVRASGMGSYSHNLLSAWVDLGIFGFLLYGLCLTGMALVLLRCSHSLYRRSDLFSLGVGYFVCTSLLLIFAKEYGYMLFGLSMGLVARLIDASRRPSAVSSPP